MPAVVSGHPVVDLETLDSRVHASVVTRVTVFSAPYQEQRDGSPLQTAGMTDGGFSLTVTDPLTISPDTV